MLRRGTVKERMAACPLGFLVKLWNRCIDLYGYSCIYRILASIWTETNVVEINTIASRVDREIKFWMNWRKP